MPRVFLALLSLTALLLSLPASAQSNRIEVAYALVNYSELLTFDVDPHTGIPTQEGEPISISHNESATVSPSPDDHFLYVLGDDAQNHQHIWVYATDSTGAPQDAPIQVVNVTNLDAFKIDPGGKLAYAPERHWSGSQAVTDTIQLFRVDPQSGLLSPSSKVVAGFSQNGPCGNAWSIEGFLELNGFNGDGSKLLDEWFCTAYDWLGGIYFAYDVNQKTGALGSEQQVFSWSEDSSVDGVWFTPRAVIDYSDPAGVEGDSAVLIYPPSGGSDPLFSCGLQMLEACASGLGGMPDPAGEYMFLQSSEYNVDITRIDLRAKKIVETGNDFYGYPLAISPDRLLIYTRGPDQDQQSMVPIYTFNPISGEVQAGGTIVLASSGYVVVLPVIRER